MLMDINLVYSKIIEKLEASNNQNVIAELENSSAGAATGSEALMSSASYLSNLQHDNPLVYELIKELIKDYLKYCKENGLIIK